METECTCVYRRVNEYGFLKCLEGDSNDYCISLSRHMLLSFMHFFLHTCCTKLINPLFGWLSFLYIHLQVTVCASEKRKKKYYNVSLIFWFYLWSTIAGCSRLSSKHMFRLRKDAECQDKHQHYNNIITINLKKKKNLTTVFLIESTPSIMSI